MTKKCITIIFLIGCVIFHSPLLGYAAKRALIIGNSTYADAPLRNPVHDATDIAAALKKLGFSVMTLFDATQQEMEQAIREFGSQLRSGDIALFYFSGHGSQVNGINYLLPIGADIYSEDEIKYKAVDAGMVLDKIERAGSRLNIIILDACRNNPYKGFRSASRGLAVMSSPSGTLIAYSTAPGTVALDGDGKNSPYTKSLLEAMQTPGLKIEEVFKNVRRSVMAETQEKQVPWESSSLTGDFYFVPTQRQEKPTPPQQQEKSTPRSQQQTSAVSRAFIETVTASSALQSQKNSQGRRYTYVAENVLDGDSNTAWVEGVSGHGIHEWLLVNFTRPVRIKTVSLVGEYKGKKNNRIKTIRLSFSDGSSQIALLNDSPAFQSISLVPTRVTEWVKFEIVDVYLGTRFEDSPISEVSFE